MILEFGISGGGEHRAQIFKKTGVEFFYVFL